MRSFSIGAMAAAGLAAMGSPAAAQGEIAPTSYQMRSVSDLAALCSARPGGAKAEAAIHLCHGFLTGVGQYHAATRRIGSPRPPLFCPPDPPPTLTQASAGFSTWARSNPQFAGEPAVDGLVRWAQATYPCSSASITPRR